AVLVKVAEVGVGLPGAGTRGVAGWHAALPWLVVLGVTAWAIHGRTTAREASRRLAWAMACGAWIMLLPTALPALAQRHNGLALLFVDVGQGDAALIRTPAGHWIEIDAGPVDAQWDAGARVIAPLL